MVQSPDIRSQIQQAVEHEREVNNFPACILHVVAPGVGLADTFAAGYREVQTTIPITGAECFRIASITKSFTAASILRLMESGRIDLETPIDEVLPNDFTDVLRDRGYLPDRVTVRHLLQHTSGLRESEGMEETLGAEPNRRWTPLEHLRETLHADGPLTAPGEAFSYCDSGYTLLGRIVEKTTSLPQAEAFRTLLRYDKLGLTHTWFESLEDPPSEAPPRAHQYWHGRDITPFDPSLDLYGGGGLLSTGKDLTSFFRALLAGRVFDELGTLDAMLQIPELQSPRQYGLGIQRNTVNGVPMWGHRGAWGCMCFHAPDIDMTVAFSRDVADVPEGYDEFRIIAEIVTLVSATHASIEREDGVRT